jgi:hypothetical protein
MEDFRAWVDLISLHRHDTLQRIGRSTFVHLYTIRILHTISFPFSSTSIDSLPHSPLPYSGPLHRSLPVSQSPINLSILAFLHTMPSTLACAAVGVHVRYTRDRAAHRYHHFRQSTYQSGGSRYIVSQGLLSLE